MTEKWPVVKRTRDDDDDDQDHWQSLGEVLRKVLEKAEQAFRENRDPRDPA